MIPLRAIQGVSLAQGSVPENLGWGVNTNEETVAMGAVSNSLVKNPGAGSLATFLGANAAAGYIVVRNATPAVADPATAAQPIWFIPLLGANAIP